MLRPHAIPPGILLLLIPEDAVVVGQAGDQIGQPIAIHVFGVDESGGAQLKLGMKRPVTVPRVARGLKTALRRDNVRMPIPAVTGTESERAMSTGMGIRTLSRLRAGLRARATRGKGTGRFIPRLSWAPPDSSTPKT